ncbi:hypothetical protein B0J13DRAFT_611964 [Dactylonectria estremocensis]|uniref:BZIP domain-containing protein n=1 Tax=Dactylonectria estremocensis TaxID=1079267 RepID=A0A9P9DTZ0_9HYPO|nr:hypothetical protein B0J13DRAFT_611964 [Dactylonectria estremocensis]
MADSSHAGLQQDSIADRWVRHDDDWSGISDTRERRRIQNRRNQRILRSRRRRELGPSGGDGAEGQQLVPAPQTSNAPAHWRYGVSDIRAVMVAVGRLNILEAGSEHNRMILQHFEAFAHQLYMTRAPQLTILPSLSHFNFIRALLANIDVLGLSSEQMDDDALSPFNLPDSHRPSTSTALVARLPDGLRPTDLQCATLHHPWIDVLPVPEMRDNLFRRGLDCFDKEEFCHALRGRIPSHDPGMLVWREPWDPSSWEVTEAFVRTWGWTITGCWGLLRSTNEWRAKRGEKPLFHLPS